MSIISDSNIVQCVFHYKTLSIDTIKKILDIVLSQSNKIDPLTLYGEDFFTPIYRMNILEPFTVNDIPKETQWGILNFTKEFNTGKKSINLVFSTKAMKIEITISENFIFSPSLNYSSERMIEFGKFCQLVADHTFPSTFYLGIELYSALDEDDFDLDTNIYNPQSLSYDNILEIHNWYLSTYLKIVS